MSQSTPPGPSGPDKTASIHRARIEARARQRAGTRNLVAPMRGMALPDKPRFSQPVRQVIMMLIVLGLVITGGAWAYGRIWEIFAANPYLNGLIIAVFFIGVLACFWQVVQLVRSVSWIERFAHRQRHDDKDADAPDEDAPPLTTGDAPLLLAPLAALLGRRSAGGAISAPAASSMQESVAARMEEARDITRYLANLLIFLGLLGTFYGLATTVPAVVETIRALAPQPDETAMQVFDKLMGGLEGQLGGMATAFSSSLLGLAGSLVVGLLELFVTHGQNRFFRELEEWMTSFTSLALSTGEDTSGHPDLQGFAQRLGAQLNQVITHFAQRDQQLAEEQAAADERALMMTAAIEAMTSDARRNADSNRGHTQALHQLAEKLVEGQNRLITLTQPSQDRPDTPGDALHDALRHLTEGQDRLIALAELTAEDRADHLAANSATIAAAQARLQSLDLQLARLIEGTSEARLTTQAELRADLAALIRAVRRLGPEYAHHADPHPTQRGRNLPGGG